MRYLPLLIALLFAASANAECQWKMISPACTVQFSSGENLEDAWGDKADLASPVFTGYPQAPLASIGDNDTSIATTSFAERAALWGDCAATPCGDGTSDGGTQFTLFKGVGESAIFKLHGGINTDATIQFGRRNAVASANDWHVPFMNRDALQTWQGEQSFSADVQFNKLIPIGTVGTYGDAGTGSHKFTTADGDVFFNVGMVATERAAGSPLIDGLGEFYVRDTTPTTPGYRESGVLGDDHTLAYLDGPIFTDDPQAPDNSAADNDDSIANTQYVDTGLDTKAPVNPCPTGTKIIEFTDGTLACKDSVQTTITSPADGHVIVYQNSTSDWRNKAMSGGASMDETGLVTLLGFSGGMTAGLETLTGTSDTLDGDNFVVLVDDDTAGSTVTITLPAVASNTGRVYHIKKLGTTASVVLDGNGAETIDGAPTHTLTTQYDARTIVCDGSKWSIF